MAFEVSEKAATEVRKVMEDQRMSAAEYAVEVAVLGSGCSGVQFKLGFRKKADVDTLNNTYFSKHGVDLVVDNRFLDLLNEVSLDYHDGDERRGFVFSGVPSGGCCGGSCH